MDEARTDIDIRPFTAEDAFAYWSTRSFIGPAVGASLKASDIVIVPYEGFRDFEGPVFPAGTEELYASLTEELPDGLKLDLAVEDEDYREVALHHDVVTVATFLVKNVVAPLAVMLIGAFLKKQLGNRFGQSRVKTSIIVQNVNPTEARSVQISYDGPAPEFERLITRALDELSDTKPHE